MLLGLQAHLRNFVQRLHSLNKLNALKIPRQIYLPFEDLIWGVLHIYQEEESFAKGWFT